MKINIQPVIINNWNYTQEAVENLIDNSFSSDIAPLNPIGEKMDYMDYVSDIEVREDGVYLPTEYFVSYKGTNFTDDTDEWEPVDYKKVFSRIELYDGIEALIKNDNSLGIPRDDLFFYNNLGIFIVATYQKSGVLWQLEKIFVESNGYTDNAISQIISDTIEKLLDNRKY